MKAEEREVEALAKVLAEHEARWTTHGMERPYGVIHCAGRCDWRLRQKVSMSNEECYVAHRTHLATVLAAVVEGARRDGKAEGLREAAETRSVLDRYFDLDADPWEDHDAACPAPEDLWRLHRELRAARIAGGGES